MKRDGGIALIQVLLMTGIIAMLMLQIGLTAKDQVGHAAAVEDRALAQLAARSHEAALVYALLTQPPRRSPDSQDPYAAVWNFRGETFTVDGARFTIQDESGLYRLPLLGASDFVLLLRSLGVESERARRLGLQLMRLQRTGKAANDDGYSSDAVGAPVYPLQSETQLRLLSDMDTALYLKLLPLVTLYPTRNFNPATAPPEILASKFTESQRAGLDELRRSGNMDLLAVWKISGSEGDETTTVVPGPALRIEIAVEDRGARLRRQMTLVLQPYADNAVIDWQRQTVTGLTASSGDIERP